MEVVVLAKVAMPVTVSVPAVAKLPVAAVVVAKPLTTRSPVTLNVEKRVVAPVTLNVLVAVSAENVGESPVPSPNDVRATLPDSYINTPAPVATMNCPSVDAAPNEFKSSNISPNA